MRKPFSVPTRFIRMTRFLRANLMGTLESVGLKYDDENAIRQRLDEVTTADIQAAAKLLTQEREVYVELLPK